MAQTPVPAPSSSLDLSQLRGRKLVIVADTDGHGIALAAAYIKAFRAAGVSDELIAVVQHFPKTPQEPATAARGDVPALIEQLAQVVDQDAIVLFLDVPIVSGKEKQHLDALARLAGRVQKVIIVDHVTHSPLYAQLTPLLQQHHAFERVEFKLKASTADTFVEPLLVAPTIDVYDLAVLGTVMDMDMAAVRAGLLANLAEIVRSAGAENEITVPTVEDIKRSYHLFVALDTLLKFEQVQAPQTGIAAIGSTAPKSVWLAEVGVKQALREAIARYPVPTPEQIAADVEIREGVVAVLRKEAPRGQGFKYAALVDAVTDAPVNVVVSEGFQPSKKLIVVTPESFDEHAAEAAEFLRAVKQQLFRKLVEAGFSDPQTDFPRGDAAYSIGVNAEGLDEALRLVTELLIQEWVKRHREKLAARIAQEELTVLVADRALATSIARIVEAAVRACAERIAEVVKG